MWWKFALEEEQTDSVSSKSDLLELQNASKFKNLDKYISKHGKPLYHGTNNTFDINDIRHQNESTIYYGLLGGVAVNRIGIFFSNNKNFAKQFGDNIHTCYLKINNPAQMDNYLIDQFIETIDPYNERELWLEASNARHDWLFFDDKLGERFVTWLKSQGYDGAIFEEEVESDNNKYVEGKTYVAFDASQVKTRENLTNTWNKSKKPVQFPLWFEEDNK
jgi:hypothetical protein